ncbi:MAG: (Fe-S)-binding protein, partial [Deltaproteobacteria bacterium]|nr:(Fe-S)-binding protein [Deltaproteobacteria bacterium]
YTKYGEGVPQAVHAVEFFLELVNSGRLQFKEDGRPIKVAYHDPCDIGRHMGLYEEPRELIKALPGVELVEFALNRQLAKCCGGGGGMKAFDLDLSLELAQKRVLQAVDLGAEAIVSACPSCKQNFVQGSARLKKAGQLKKKMKVMDVTELLAKRLA